MERRLALADSSVWGSVKARQNEESCAAMADVAQTVAERDREGTRAT